ncbi:MAG: hypothetical protein AABZ23_03830 [Deltaproteobacteria bacterium]
MECPYLEERKAMSFCNASGRLMAPGMEEMGELCTTEDHYRCLRLLGYALRQGGRMLLFEKF